jgi:hypothetical protein
MTDRNHLALGFSLFPSSGFISLLVGPGCTRLTVMPRGPDRAPGRG